MDAEKLIKLIESLVSLKDKLKCPICLGIIQDVVELNCGHKYCKECYAGHKSTQKQPCCPVCKRILKRRSSLYCDDEYANSLGKFVNNCLENIREVYGCEVEQLQKTLSSRKDATPKVSSDLLRKVSNLGKTNILPSTSKTAKRETKTSSLKTNQEDAFDKLMNAVPIPSLCNKKATKRVYTNKKKEEPKLKYNILEFDNYENKTVVLRWLNDTRNKFDRLTQTQTFLTEEIEVPVIDLESISQLGQKVVSSKPVAQKLVHWGRAKSLDIDVKKPTTKLKRYSDRGRSADAENYDIEDVNTEEEAACKKAEQKVLLEVIEDEFLKTLELEMSVNGNKSLERDKKLKNKKRTVNIPSQASTTGWERLTKMEKSIKKKERVPKQLNITLQSAHASETKCSLISSEKSNSITTQMPNAKGDYGVTDDGKKESVESNNMCHVDVDAENVNKNTEFLKNKEKTVSYDLNKVEAYITKNMKVIESGPLDTSATAAPTQPDVQEKSSEKHEVLADEEEAEIRDDIAFEITNPKLIIDSRKCQEKAAADIISHVDDEEDIFARLTQKSIFHAPDVGKKSSLVQDNIRTMTNNDDINNALDQEDIEDMYSLPTQKISHKCKDSYHVREKWESVADLLQLVEDSLMNCLENLKSSTDMVVERHFGNLQYYVTKLKSLKLYEKDESVIADIRNVCDAATQTLLATSGRDVQTEIHERNVGIQTEPMHGCRCTVDRNDDAERWKPNVSPAENAIKYTKEPEITFKRIAQSKPANSKAPSQNDIFTETFDGLNFETQDLTKDDARLPKNYKNLPDGINLPLPNKAQATAEAVNEVTNQISPGSILVCTLTPTHSKVSRKVNIEGDKSKKFKRIRTLVDSDSDGEPEAKRLCNRFVRDDLTIEFQTYQSRAENPVEIHPKDLDSQNSENINYDEYLAQLMKKYDTNTSSGSSKSAKEPAIVSPNRELMRKCEQMLERATENPKKLRTICGFSPSSSKVSYRTADGISTEPLSADRMFMDEHNLSKLENDIQQYERRSFNRNDSETCDIIGKTEEEPLGKKMRYNSVNRNNSQLASLFCQSQNDDVVEPRRQTLCNNPDSDSLFGQSENLDQQLQEIKGRTVESASLFCESEKFQPPVQDNPPICVELDDSFDNVELENIEIPDAEANTKKDKNLGEKIVVLNDVVIKSPVKVADEEMFSDDDIVESTPQKRLDSFGERCGVSQSANIGNLSNLTVPKLLTENFDFDFVPLPPPPDFQDDNDPTATDMDDISVQSDDETVANLNKGSLTPDRLSQFSARNSKDMSQILSTNMDCGKDNHNQNNLSLTPDKLSQFDTRLAHSSPAVKKNLTLDPPVFSPIPLPKPQRFGIADMAAASKYNPLSNISRHTSQKQNLFTSTPGQKSIWNYVRPSQSKDNDKTTITKSKPCIACTRLTKEQTKLVCQLTNKKLATYSSQFDSGVTHMIVVVNENNYVKDYTIKFVSAVAAGIWVLRYEWIEECFRNNCIVPEEPFEVLDISGMPGPRTARLYRKQNPLFKGFKFYCVEPFISTTKGEIENIITLLEGKVLKHLKNLLDDDGNLGLIIGEGHATQDFEQFERWVGLYKSVTVDIEWLSKCVGQYKIISIRPYVWCSEDNLGDLGYPPNLIESVPFSFSESF